MPIKNQLLITAVSVILCVIFIACVSFWLSSILLPLFVAFVIAYVLDPLVLWAESRNVPRSVAILAMFILIFVISGGMLFFFTNALSREFQAIQGSLPEYAFRLFSMVPHNVKVFLDIDTPEKIQNHINMLLTSLKELPIGVYRDTFTFVGKAFSTTLSFILTILSYLIIPVYLYYFLKDMPQMRKGFNDFIPFRWRNRVGSMSGEVHEVLGAFIRGQLSVCIILAILYSIGLSIIGIDLAVLIGTLAGLAFIIPYLGTLIGIVFSMIMAFLKFQDILHPLLCLGWFSIVQTLEGGVITPKIVGDKVGLHPLVIMLSLMIGGQIGGVFGMLMAVPVTAVLNVFAQTLLAIYRNSGFFTESE